MASHFTVLQFTCTLLYSVRSCLPFEPSRSLELPLMTSASSMQLSSVRAIQRIYTKAQLSQQMVRPFKSAANGSCSASTVARLPGSRSVSVSDVRRGWCTIIRSITSECRPAGHLSGLPASTAGWHPTAPRSWSPQCRACSLCLPGPCPWSAGCTPSPSSDGPAGSDKSLKYSWQPNAILQNAQDTGACRDLVLIHVVTW